MSEEWRAVVGYEGLYEVSDLGRVRNVSKGMGRTPGKILKPAKGSRYEYRSVTLRKDGVSTMVGTHRLVCLSFKGPPPTKESNNVLHWDGDPTNNTPENLRWGTKKENALDSVRHGTRRNQYSVADHCSQGHPLTEEHLYTNPKTGKRRCVTCQKTPPPPGSPLHGKYTTYGTKYCRCPECTEAWRVHSKEQYRKRRIKK